MHTPGFRSNSWLLTTIRPRPLSHENTSYLQTLFSKQGKMIHVCMNMSWNRFTRRNNRSCKIGYPWYLIITQICLFGWIEASAKSTYCFPNTIIMWCCLWWTIHRVKVSHWLLLELCTVAVQCSVLNDLICYFWHIKFAYVKVRPSEQHEPCTSIAQ